MVTPDIVIPSFPIIGLFLSMMFDLAFFISPGNDGTSRQLRRIPRNVLSTLFAYLVLSSAMSVNTPTSEAEDSLISSDTTSNQREPAAEISTPVVHVAEPILHESSGLAVSRRAAQRFWSHNDSGGKPQLFAFDDDGNRTGRCRLIDAKANDWEDMACYRQDNVSRILVADCGDNQRRRSSITLYLMDEPDPDTFSNVRDYQTLRVTYPDGSHNCEAVAVDPVRGQIILIAKTSLPFAGIYTTPLPSRTRAEMPKIWEVSASRVGTLALPLVSAMDLHPTSGDVWIVNYFKGFRFPCHDRTGSLAEQLGGLPKGIDLPKWKQIEAIAVDDEHGVWLTSEGSLTPFAKLNP